MLPNKVKEVPHFNSATEALSNLTVRRNAVQTQQLASMVIKLPKVVLSEYQVSSVETRIGVDSDTDDRSGVVIYSDKSSGEEEKSEELLLCNDPLLTDEELMEI